MLLKLFIQVVIMVELRCKLIFPRDLDMTVTKYSAAFAMKYSIAYVYF